MDNTILLFGNHNDNDDYQNKKLESFVKSLNDNTIIKDKKFFLNAVEKNGLALQYFDEIYKSDYEIVLAAVTSNSNALQFASNFFKKDRSIVLQAVGYSGFALEYADNLLK